MKIIILILIGIIIYIVSFNKSKNELDHSIRSYGGMDLKYKRLLDNLRILNPEFKILAQTQNSITIGSLLPNGYMNFHLVHTFDKLHIRFNIKESVIGYHKFESVFHPELSQDRMFEELKQQLALLDTKLYNKYFL